MIHKSASEIIHAALVKSGTRSIDFLDSMTITNELNNAYRELYEDIITYNEDRFIKKCKIKNHDRLPPDCYRVVKIEDGDRILNKQAGRQRILGTYNLENDHFNFYSDPVYSPEFYTLYYIPIPATITMPREGYELKLPDNVTQIGLVTDKGFFYKTSTDENNAEYFYDFDSDTSYEQEYKNPSNKFGRFTISVDYDNQIIYMTEIRYDGEEPDILDFEIDTELHGKMINLVHDFPYLYASFEDGTILVGDTPGNWSEYNVRVFTGKKTLGNVVGVCTNDSTLWGTIIQYEDGSIWRESFVPDTILFYPSNALFVYMENILAKLLCSMNGIENKFIEQECERTELEFRRSLRSEKSKTTRIRNVYGYGWDYFRH